MKGGHHVRNQEVQTGLDGKAAKAGHHQVHRQVRKSARLQASERRVGDHDDGRVSHEPPGLLAQAGRGQLARGARPARGSRGAPPGEAARDRRQTERLHRRLQPDQVRLWQDHRGAHGASQGDHPRDRGRGGSPQGQEGCGRNRGLLPRAGHPRVRLCRRLVRELRGAPGTGWGEPGARHPHERTPGDQREEPDRARTARHVRAGLRGGPEPLPRALRHRATLHLRALPAVFRVLDRGGMGGDPGLRPGLHLLRRRLRSRHQPGIRDARGKLRNPRVPGRGDRAQGQRHHERLGGSVRHPGRGDHEDLSLHARKPQVLQLHVPDLGLGRGCEPRDHAGRVRPARRLSDLRPRGDRPGAQALRHPLAG